MRQRETVMIRSFCVGECGRVLAFDIQKEAVENTKKRILEHQMEKRADVFLESHTKMRKYAKEETVDCIVFNFGYLPGGDHQLATKADTSIEAIRQGLRLLKVGGMMSLCIYSGGDSGFEERDAILSFLKFLDTKYYLVILSSYYNRPNHPPIPVMILKLKSDVAIHENTSDKHGKKQNNLENRSQNRLLEPEFPVESSLWQKEVVFV